MRRGFPYGTSIPCKKEGKIYVEGRILRSVTMSRDNQECQRQIFTERLPEGVAPSARRTTRLCDLLTLIGFAMGGEAGNGLVERMG